MKNILIIFLFFFPFGEINPQTEQIKNFFKDLINNESNLSPYLHPDDLKKSNRLGINYKDINNKFLIAYDIDESIKTKINKSELSYRILNENLEDSFSKATFQLANGNYAKDFYFKNNKLISNSGYFTRNWKERESKYFRIILSDLGLFNDYSINQLDNFVEVMLALLNITESEKALLEREKIIYILCRDEKEIELVSGFNTRGIYILAYDEIITTYNCHFHEIAHLLINFRLKNLPLYTLPFFQEGFATAVGGRGGLGRNVLLDIGHFLQVSKFIPFNSIITKAEFMSEDASLTYPVAAFYNLFLLNELGIELYLKLYSANSGNADFINNLALNSIMLAEIEKFYVYSDYYYKQGGIDIYSDEKFTSIVESKSGSISESENFYLIKVRSNLLLKTINPLSNYKSKKFEEVFPGINYDGSKYLIKVDAREINIYNLYTNILIGSYSAGFTLENKEVPSEDGYFVFYVRKDLFDENIKELIISDI